MECYIIDDYIESIEISREGILIKYELKSDELIPWHDDRIVNFLPVN